MRPGLRSIALALALASVPLAAGCATSGTGGATADGDAIATTSFNAVLEVELAAMTRSFTGLYVRDLRPGDGIRASEGDLVRIRYDVSLPSGVSVGGTAPSDPPFEFRLGRRQVIAAWDEGVTGMRVGARRQLVVPPSLGYGSRARGDIPPNSILVFTVDLVGIGG